LRSSIGRQVSWADASLPNICVHPPRRVIDLNGLAERYAASSTTLVISANLVCSTAGLPEGPFSSPKKEGLRQNVLLRLRRSVALDQTRSVSFSSLQKRQERFDLLLR